MSAIPLTFSAPSIMTTEEWVGFIRIEGNETTLFHDEITVGSTTVAMKNIDTGEYEDLTMESPTVLGALAVAADQAGFSYELEYWPSWDAILVKSIGDESDWWHFLVDYSIPMISADNYLLFDNDTSILWGYLEDWYVHALQVSVDRTEIKKNEDIIVTVTDELQQPASNALIYISDDCYEVDNGVAVISFDEPGSYKIYAESDGCIRSETIGITVQKAKLSFFELLDLFFEYSMIRKIFYPFI